MTTAIENDRRRSDREIVITTPSPSPTQSTSPTQSIAPKCSITTILPPSRQPRTATPKRLRLNDNLPLSQDTPEKVGSTHPICRDDSLPYDADVFSGDHDPSPTVYPFLCGCRTNPTFSPSWTTSILSWQGLETTSRKTPKLEEDISALVDSFKYGAKTRGQAPRAQSQKARTATRAEEPAAAVDAGAAAAAHDDGAATAGAAAAAYDDGAATANVAAAAHDDGAATAGATPATAAVLPLQVCCRDRLWWSGGRLVGEVVSPTIITTNKRPDAPPQAVEFTYNLMALYFGETVCTNAQALVKVWSVLTRGCLISDIWKRPLAQRRPPTVDHAMAETTCHVDPIRGMIEIIKTQPNAYTSKINTDAQLRPQLIYPPNPIRESDHLVFHLGSSITKLAHLPTASMELPRWRSFIWRFTCNQ
ncbi:hypothetical protein CONLIGDRAFT_687671 [Coniochaeta ligniaria NRRL 30616]|uniref:Uncharacterized protein n=1 Tax=Coniochaeta ligniaria NRRL 30616 TaxID=1408157 RepID=A0A1J7IMF6_9PEZI|nr:hypothetical protein CONLIGDRAFT_687671 [Coniochaeta ligniaria NRRL 30616]